MAEKNIILILLSRSREILREEGIKGFFQRFRRYYEEYPPLRYHLYYWVRSKLSRKKVIVREVQGSRMYLNLNDFGLSKHLYFFGIREPECTRIWKTMVKPGMTIVELGANIGYYACMEAFLMKGKGKIYAIEPFPPNYEMLKKNIELNTYSPLVETFHLAISNKSGKDKLFMSKEHNLVNMLQSESGDYVEIETATLDDFLVGKKQPDLIRMDIEGFEYYVLDGMKNTLQSVESCAMFIEVHPFQMFEKGLDYKKPLRALFDAGFYPSIAVKEFGPLKEVSYRFSGPVDEFFSFMKEKMLTPPENTHGFGLFLEKKPKRKTKE